MRRPWAGCCGSAGRWTAWRWRSSWPRRVRVLSPPQIAARLGGRLVSGMPAGVARSVKCGTVGDSYDNGMAELVIGLYKTECVSHDGPFRGVDDLELATLSWVHWFNNDRLYSSIGYQTPIEHEDECSIKTGPDSNRCGRTRPPLNPGQFTMPSGVRGKTGRMMLPRWDPSGSR